MSLAKKLIDLRKRRRYTQQYIADICNISRQSVIKWESGEREPQIECLKCLSRLYKVSIDYLVNDEIKQFEDIKNISKVKLQQALENVNPIILAKALMGASPEVNKCIKEVCWDVDFESIKEKLNPIEVSQVDSAEKEILKKINYVI